MPRKTIGTESDRADAATAATPPGEDDPTEEKAQPVHKIRIRNVTGAIWQNARQDGTPFFTFTATRSYPVVSRKLALSTGPVALHCRVGHCCKLWLHSLSACDEQGVMACG